MCRSPLKNVANEFVLAAYLVHLTLKVCEIQKRPVLFKSAQWHFHQSNAPVHNSILARDYMTKMGIKTVPQPLYSPDLALCDFCLFPKLRGCRYETIEEMKEAVTKLMDSLTQEDFDGAFQKLLERYNKWIAAGGDYFEEVYSFMCVLSIKVPTRKNYLMIIVTRFFPHNEWTLKRYLFQCFIFLSVSSFNGISTLFGYLMPKPFS